MGWLDNLPGAWEQFKKDVTNPHQGKKVGSVDFGFSEFLQNIIKPAYANEWDTSPGSNLFGDDTRYDTQTAATLKSAAEQKAINDQTRSTLNNTQQKTGVPINQDPNAGNKSKEDLERELYAQRVANNQHNLNVLLNNIKNQIGFADKRRGIVQGALDTNYWGDSSQVGMEKPTGGLIGSNLEKLAAELGFLGEKEGFVNDSYLGNAEKGMKGYYALNEDNRNRMITDLDKNAALAKELASSAIATNAKKLKEQNTLNRVLARARGMTGSSTYGGFGNDPTSGIQGKARYQAENAGAAILKDVGDKIFESGQEKGRQNNWYDQKGDELRTEYDTKATGIKQEKFNTQKYHGELDRKFRDDYKAAWDTEQNDYDEKVSGLMAQEQIYGIDNADRLDQLYYEHNQKLNAIRDYAEKVEDKKKAVAQDYTSKQNSVNSRSAIANINPILAQNKAVDTMADAKTSDVYNQKIADNSANTNALNLKLADLANMGLPQEADSSAKLNIRNPNALKKEDEYGYYLTNLLNNLKGFGTA